MSQSVEGSSSPLNRIRKFLFGEATSLSAHIKLIAAPTYRRLLRYEWLLRLIIPSVCLLSIGVIGIYRGVDLSNDYDRTETEAHDKLILIAHAVATRIDNAEDHFSVQVFRVQLQEALTEGIPPSSTGEGRRIFITSNDGQIVANAPYDNKYEGTQLSDLVESSRPLFVFGKDAGIQPVTFEGREAIATAHHLEDGLNMLVVLQPNDAIFANWRSDMSAEVMLFVVTSSLFLALIYGFFSLSVRTKQADEIYSTTRERIDAALSRGRCGLFDWDIASGHMFWSKSMFEILGLTPLDELIGFTEVAALIHPDDESLFDVSKLFADEEEQLIDQTFRMKHVNGSWIWMRIRAQQVLQENFEDARMIGIAVDITEQKNLEEAKSMAEMRIHDALEMINEAFVLWDSENKLVMCNTTYRNLNGLKDEEAVPGTPYAEIMRVARRPLSAVKVKEKQNIQDGKRDYFVPLADGRTFKIAERRTKDDGWVLIGTDITSVKQFDAESRKKSEKLKELNERYEEEKRRAEEANKSKSDFVANISHELRTPLNAIIGFSDIMRQETFGELGNEKYKEYCDDINQSGMDLLGLINDILDMSKIEAGRMELKFETFDTSELLNEVVRTTDTSAKKKNITVSMESDDEIRLTADRRSIKQILLNILSNSIKFTEDGGSIAIQTLEQNGRALITVEDTGVGIPQEDIPRLGQPFMQLENQMTKTYDGTGLGLSIAQSLVQLHDGELTIESEVGKGTKVTISLPYRVPAQSPQDDLKTEAA